MIFRICSYNIQKFNFPDKKERPKRIARLISENKIAVIAIQEVFREQAIIEIKKNLGDNYDGRFESSGKDGEGYGYIWDKRMLTLVEGENIRGRKITNPQIINDNSSFVRPPFYIRFSPTQTKTPFEIRLLNTHIRFSKNNKADEDEDDFNEIQEAGMIELRRKEFDNLIRYYYKYCIPNDGNGSAKYAYTILLGDYNLCLKESGIAPYLDTLNQKRSDITRRAGTASELHVETFQSHLSTLRIVPKEIQQMLDANQQIPDEYEHIYETKLSHNYDHFTFDTNSLGKPVFTVDSLGQVKTNPDIINVLGTIDPKWKDIYEYRKKYSDHLPIIMDFDLKERTVSQVSIKGGGM